MPHDPVTNPAHYRGTKIDWLDVVDDWNLPPRVANAVKYICRYRKKGTPAEDLRKGARYLVMEAEKIDREATVPEVVQVYADIPRA